MESVPLKVVRCQRQPRRTVLWQIVHEHLKDFLGSFALQKRKLPWFIEQTLRAYLECGIPEYGCMKLWCRNCGHVEFVAWSCKKRGVCPSCAAHRAAERAMTLVKHVLPEVNYRHWTMSLPLDWQGKLGFHGEVTTKIETAMLQEMRSWQEDRCGKGKTGGVAELHRFDQRMDMRLHVHVLMMEGVYQENDEGKLVWKEAPAVSEEEVRELLDRIKARAEAVWKRLKMDTAKNEEEGKDAGGAARREGAVLADEQEEEVERPRELVARTGTWSLYGSKVIEAKDRERLEGVLKYIFRGPITNSRLSKRADGNVEYRLRKPDRKGNTVVVFTPKELMMKLISLIPKKGMPLRRYFGILAAGSKARRKVVLKAPPRQLEKKAEEPTTKAQDLAALLPMPRPRTDWGELLRRIWNVEAVLCPKCFSVMERVAMLLTKADARRELLGDVKSGAGPPQSVLFEGNSVGA